MRPAQAVTRGDLTRIFASVAEPRGWLLEIDRSFPTPAITLGIAKKEALPNGLAIVRLSAPVLLPSPADQWLEGLCNLSAGFRAHVQGG